MFNNGIYRDMQIQNKPLIIWKIPWKTINIFIVWYTPWSRIFSIPSCWKSFIGDLSLATIDLRFGISYFAFLIWNFPDQLLILSTKIKRHEFRSEEISQPHSIWAHFLLRIRTISTSWILPISNLLKFYFLSSQKFLLIQIQVNMKPKNGSHVLKVVELFHQHHSNFLLHELGKLETYKFMFHDNWMTTYFCFSRYFRINFFLERAPWTSILWCRSIYCVCKKFTFLLMLLFTLFIEFWHNTKNKFDK